ASRTFSPQSFSGFSCECVCLTARRVGQAVLYDARSAPVRSDVKFEFLPALAASERRPFCSVTVCVARSWMPLPVPLSVYATTHPCLSPHSPAVPIAPYTPREPEEGAVT